MNGSTRFKAVTATHTPGSLEFNLNARPVASETVAASASVVCEGASEATGGKQPIVAPQSISVSIAANGKETDQFAGAKCAAQKATKGATSAANLVSQVKEKRSRPGRPPKNANRAGKDLNHQDSTCKE